MHARHVINDYFEKHFEFTGNELWKLPETAYESSPWQVESLQKLKTDLNTVKGQLNKFDINEWSEHTRSRDPSSSIIPTLKEHGCFELLTQAWCKFYECLNRYPIVSIQDGNNKFTSVHLCEAPGAFISALNRFLYTHHRNVDWKWQANTLNPYYEGNTMSKMIPDDRLISHTLKKWDFGVDNTGDLMKYYNHQQITQTESCLLVTGDGSIDCMNNPGEQESIVHFLHYCETMTALKILKRHGTFVLKLFTMFEHTTICLMYLLTCSFTKIHVFKPCSSKSGNSEVYVICLNFKGADSLNNLWESLLAPYRGEISTSHKAMFHFEEINPNFLSQIEECNQYFVSKQCRTINENIKHFPQEESDSEIHRLKVQVAQHFMKTFPIAFHVPKRLRLIKKFKRKLKPSDWDFKSIHTGIDVHEGELQFSIKLGRALREVVTSRFCQTDISATIEVNEEVLLQKISTFLSPNHVALGISHFEPNLPQDIFQKQFFNYIKETIEHNKDIVIVGVPLLTRFLVGLIYILTLNFESMLVYKEGALILQKSTRKQTVQTYLTAIESAYESLEHTDYKFVPDIMEIVPNHVLLDSGNFYDTICRYNNGIYRGAQV